jgi:lysophospholipid acyltransferase (LPLAT)-like uncharacterized protein
VSALPPGAIAIAGACAVRALGLTLRLTVIGLDALRPAWRERRPLIYALWHGRLLMVPWVSAKLAGVRDADVAGRDADGTARDRRAIRVLASRSRDGELMTRFVRRFGLETVRGSSSRGGAPAVRALAAALRAGDDVVLAPDGPRGPRQRVQPGLAALAAITGAPVVPLAFAARPARRLHTWDAFLIPAPFARCALVFGDVVCVRRDEDRGAATERLERALDGATTKADLAVRA